MAAGHEQLQRLKGLTYMLKSLMQDKVIFQILPTTQDACLLLSSCNNTQASFVYPESGTQDPPSGPSPLAYPWLCGHLLAIQCPLWRPSLTGPQPLHSLELLSFVTSEAAHSVAWISLLLGSLVCFGLFRMWISQSWDLELESGWFRGRSCREGIRDSLLYSASLAWLPLEVKQVEL